MVKVENRNQNVESNEKTSEETIFANIHNTKVRDFII